MQYKAITIDAGLAASLRFAFAALCKPERDTPETVLDYEKRQAFLAALNALGIRYKEIDTRFFGHALRILSPDGKPLEIYAA